MGIVNSFDGVICFGGEDWWYHNKGHFDIQIMREFSKDRKVIFINSVGMRMPTLGKTSRIGQKIVRKLRSILKGAQQVEPNFYVFSPLYIPGRLGSEATSFLLYFQVRLFLWRLKIKEPLVWVVTPTVSKVAFKLSDAVVYQRTDKNEELKDGNRDYIGRHVDKLRRKAILTVYSSLSLMNIEKNFCNRYMHVDHGVADVFFDKSLIANDPFPSSCKKRVLFVGAIDDHTFDLELLKSVVINTQGCEFYLVGDATIDIHKLDLDNLNFLGKKEQWEIPAYLHHADVLTMFWKRNGWIEFCSPIKFKEYLTANKPIITTRFNGCDRYETDQVFVVDDADEFSKALVDSVYYGEGVSMDLERWSDKAQILLERLENGPK